MLEYQNRLTKKITHSMHACLTVEWPPPALLVPAFPVSVPPGCARPACRWDPAPVSFCSTSLLLLSRHVEGEGWQAGEGGEGPGVEGCMGHN